MKLNTVCIATLVLLSSSIGAQGQNETRNAAGNSRISESSRVLVRNGLVVSVRDMQVTNVGEVISLPIAEVDPDITLPKAEVLDLSCGTLEWDSLTANERSDLWGRTEYMLRREGTLTGAVGLVGPGGISNPRARGKAIATIVIRDGKLMADIHPPFDGRGNARFRVFVASLNDTNRTAFRDLVAKSPRRPDVEPRQDD